MSAVEVSSWFKEAKKRYEEAKCILSDQGKNDSPNEPHKSKNEAKKILKKLYKTAHNFSPVDSKISFCLLCVKALLSYELGVIAYDTEEFNSCGKYLQESWELLKDHTSKTECVALAIEVLNHLAVLWAQREDPRKAQGYLKRAEVIYAQYKKESKLCPFNLEDLFSILDEGKAEFADWSYFEKTLTHTFYYLAQAYECLGEAETSAKYCHVTLRRQLESKDYDFIDWSINCATISQYFIAHEQFNAARHVLACASLKMSEYEEQLKVDHVKEDDEKWQDLQRALADIARCWTKYAVQLLLTSSEKMINGEQSISNLISETATSELDATKDCIETDASMVSHIGTEFPMLSDITKTYKLIEESIVKEFENQITCCPITTFEQAREIFMCAKNWVNQSKKFYVLNDYASDHVSIQQDYIKLYKYLAFFEYDEDRQCKMHKRRVDMLEDIIQKLNAQYYLSLCRQLLYDLADAYNHMFDLKVFLASKKQVTTPHMVKKINFLATKAITTYQSFIDTTRDSRKQLPKTFPDEIVRPILLAYFCMGRLYYKLRVDDKSVKISNLKKNEECFKFIVNYSERNPDHKVFVMEHLSVIEEMIQLIPAKIQAIVGDSM